MWLSRRWLTLAIVSSALFLIVIDMSVLYTALPALTRELQAGITEKLWIVNAYPLVVAGLLPPMGALGDRFGHRRMFLSGLLVFGMASVLAALSPSAGWLIAWRVLLALGAAMMMPATLALIRTTFTDPQERSLAIGIWASVAGGGAAAGPVVGGILLEYFWWGSVFLINVPVVLAAGAAGLRYIPAVRGNPEQGFELLSALQILTGLTALIFAIKELSGRDPSLAVIMLAGLLGIVLIAAFIRRQRYLPMPVVDFALFRHPRFSAGMLAALVASASLAGMELVITQRLQLVLGLSPLQAGLHLLPYPLAALIAAPLAGLVAPKLRLERVLPLSLLIAALAALVSACSLTQPVAWQLLVLGLLGFGLGASMTLASTAVMFSAPAEQAGMAASLEEVSYELGGSLGIALLGSLMSAVYIASFALPSPVGVPAAALESIDTVLMLADSLPEDVAQILQQAAHSAFDRAVQMVLLAGSGLLLMAAVAVVLLLRRQQPLAE